MTDIPSDVAGPPPEPRRYPSTFGGMCYLAVLAATVVGLLWVILGDWRFGSRIIGAALIAAGGLRLVLPQRSAGMLAVRHRLVDVVMLAAAGASVVLLSVVIPEQPI